jgi:hypothetical protein
LARLPNQVRRWTIVTVCAGRYDKFKALLRAKAARTIPDLWDAIRIALDAFTPSECQNYFAAAGYDAT